MSEEKTQINDINRSLYDFRYEENENDFYRIEDGLTKEIIQKLSEEKDCLQNAAESKNDDLIKEKFGYFMFMAVLTARTLGLEPEECLSASSEKFIRQFAAAEKIAKEEEKPLSEIF